MGQTTSGISPRNSSSCTGFNNLPPLQFHPVHGGNIRISRNGTLAKRYESFCKGVTFSARPVRINERVCIKFSEISNNWSGVIRFGFTSNDPATLRSGLPKYACPDLTNKPGFWAKALNERFAERNNVLFYYVNSSGQVYFGVNGEEKGVIISGVDTRDQLWALIDVYGNCTAIEFLDSRVSMYQQSGQQQAIQPQHQHQQQQPHSSRHSMSETEIDRILPNMQSLNVNGDVAGMMPPLRYIPPSKEPLIPVPFHMTRGRNIIMSNSNYVATRADTEFCQGYVFTSRPLRIGEKIIVQILRTENMYVGALTFGLTSCNPATLQPADLPDDADLLLDRPEYWVVSKDVVATPQRGDEILICVTSNGEVQISKNGGPVSVIMHVDQSLLLWPFLDVYGSTQSVRVFSQPPMPPSHPVSPRGLQVQIPNSESMKSINSQLSQHSSSSCSMVDQPPRSVLPVQSTGHVISVPNCSDMIQLQPGGTVLVVNLPPAHSNEAISCQQIPPRITQMSMSAAGSSTTLASNYSNTYMEPVCSKQTNVSAPITASCSSTVRQDMLNQQQQYGATITGAECTICYENPINSALYTCGHMCMCVDCANKQWKGIGGGHCPLCRAVIRDVIRLYRS